jgi:hypothetical protein
LARVAGESIGASLRLPNMATEAFLACLSRDALEAVARDAGVTIAPRLKDTRARLVARFAGATWHYPAALFRLGPDELADDKPGRYDGAAGEEAGSGDDETSGEADAAAGACPEPQQSGDREWADAAD